MVARREVPKFAVTTSVEASTTVVTVRGELDIASAAELREALLRLIADEMPHLTIDGSGITFVDSSGLAVLMMAARRWEKAGRRIALRSPSQTLARIVDLTGVRRAFDVD